jgi:hypothetical protein
MVEGPISIRWCAGLGGEEAETRVKSKGKVERIKEVPCRTATRHEQAITLQLLLRSTRGFGLGSAGRGQQSQVSVGG